MKIEVKMSYVTCKYCNTSTLLLNYQGTCPKGCLTEPDLQHFNILYERVLPLPKDVIDDIKTALLFEATPRNGFVVVDVDRNKNILAFGDNIHEARRDFEAFFKEPIKRFLDKKEVDLLGEKVSLKMVPCTVLIDHEEL